MQLLRQTKYHAAHIVSFVCSQQTYEIYHIFKYGYKSQFYHMEQNKMQTIRGKLSFCLYRINFGPPQI